MGLFLFFVFFLFPEVGNKGKSYVSASLDILDNSMLPTLP